MATDDKIPTYRLDTTMSYDRDEGVLSFTDGFIRDEIRVRANLREQAIRQACIIELERLGYTVISPEETLTDTVSWYITFGFGGPYGGQYTEILVPADLPREEQQLAARTAAFARYGKEWAFDYGSDQFDRCIAKYGMTRRERISA